MTCSDSFIASIEPDIISSEINTSPNPANDKPIVLVLSFFPNIFMKIPIKARIATYATISKLCKATIWAVIVVPILAPIIIVVA